MLDELKKYRRIAGLTQNGLAKRAGVDIAVVCRLEKGRRSGASYETIVRLARALNLEPEELVAVGVTTPIAIDTTVPIPSAVKARRRRRAEASA